MDFRHAWTGKALPASAATLWKIFAAAAGSFVPLLFLQSVGEEAVYTIIPQEMWAAKSFVVPTLYGGSYGRPPLCAWLTLIPTAVLGEQHVRIAARLVSISSTLLTGLILAWLVRRLFGDRRLAAFAAAVYLSGDTLLAHGWHASADPTFALCTFAAMACLWVAAEEKRPALLLVAGLALIGSFLAKVPTGYLFYALFALVLIWRHPNRGVLLTPWSAIAHIGALAFPFVWNYVVAGDTVFAPAVAKILQLSGHAQAAHIVAYVGLLAFYPLRVVWDLMPASAIVVYCLVARRIPRAALRNNAILIAAVTVAVNVLPYWFVPESNTRYLMPLYPLCALLMAYVLLNSGAWIADIGAKALIAAVAVAYLASLAGYPLYERYFRGDYAKAAQAVVARAADFPLYVTDNSAIGLSIAGEIDTQRLPRAPITYPPANFASGFVLSDRRDAAIGPVALTLKLGRDTTGTRTRYLLCRGAACAAAAEQPRELSF